AFDLVFLSNVDGHRERTPAEIGDRLGDGLEMLELARAQRDVRARTRELDRDRFSDAGAAARDDGGLAFERERGFGHGGDDTPAVRPRLRARAEPEAGGCRPGAAAPRARSFPTRPSARTTRRCRPRPAAACSAGPPPPSGPSPAPSPPPP